MGRVVSRAGLIARIAAVAVAVLLPCGMAPAQVKPEALKAQMAPAAKPSAPKPAAPKQANIDRNGVLILIRSALFALDQANKTGNYTVLRDLGAPAFQVNSAARLAEIFASQRKEGLDLAGLAVLEPQLNVPPQIRDDGMMRITGFFPSVPMQVNFDLLFAPVDRQWRVFGISVNLSKGGPQAPAMTEARPAPAPKPQPPPVPPTPEVKVQRPPAPH